MSNVCRFCQIKSVNDLRVSRLFSAVQHRSQNWADYVFFAVINPSFFEGWGNTLEYAINLKKIAIISNIDVHREKISKNKLLFNPKNHIKLSNIMLKVFLNQKKMEKKIKAEKDKINSVIKFYSDYLKILIR